MPTLRRVRDGEGFIGLVVDAIGFDENGKTKICGDVPMIGYALKVGSVIAGTYSTRDWWMTSPITEFIKETENENGEYYLKFKTNNSEYEFWGIKNNWKVQQRHGGATSVEY